MHVRPLTHRGADGHVYTRPPEVEAQIVNTLGLEWQELGRRASVTDREHADYLKDETIVYLLRESYRADDLKLGDIFAGALSQRCFPYARKHFRSFVVKEDFDDAHAELRNTVIEMILELESDRGDFLQVRFGRKLRLLAIDIFKRRAPLINEIKDQVFLSSVAGYDGSDNDEERRHPLPSELRAVDDGSERRRQADEALQRLPEPQRTAFILKHYDDWPIQSKKPGTPSISAVFGVDPRTIHNWLTAAEKALETWRGQQS